MPTLQARIQAFELAFRMQTEAPEALTIDQESEATKKLYGLDRPETRDFGWQCLLTGRLAERDVRFIQSTHSTGADDVGPAQRIGPAPHGTALQVDEPIAGLLKDLKARGLLKDTLGSVGCRVWSHTGCSSGRRPRSQSVRLLDVDGGRRRERWDDLRGHR